MFSPVAPIGQVKIVQTAVEFNEYVSPTNQENVQVASEVAHLREFEATVKVFSIFLYIYFSYPFMFTIVIILFYLFP